MNPKVKRLLDTLAIVMKDEDPRLIQKIHDVINDEVDGYEHNFKQVCHASHIMILGKSY